MKTTVDIVPIPTVKRWPRKDVGRYRMPMQLSRRSKRRVRDDNLMVTVTEQKSSLHCILDREKQFQSIIDTLRPRYLQNIFKKFIKYPWPFSFFF
jgi:hypothetical protein